MTTRQQVNRVRRRLDLVSQIALTPRRRTPLVKLPQQRQCIRLTEREPMHQHRSDMKSCIVAALPADRRRTLADVSACPFNRCSFHKVALVVLMPLHFAQGAGVEVRPHQMRIKPHKPTNAHKWNRAFGHLRAEPSERWPALGIREELFQQMRRVNQSGLLVSYSIFIHIINGGVSTHRSFPPLFASVKP